MSSTSLIRVADADARGTITKMTDTMISENMICIAYWINAINAPTCIWPSLIRMPPNQTMAIVEKFMTSIMIGIMAAMILLTLTAVCVKS